MSNKHCVPIVIAAENEPFRLRVAREIRVWGIEPAIVGNAGAVWEVPAAVVDDGIVVLETNDDVARLVQIVNDLYRSSYHRAGAEGTICVVSPQTFEQNQWLGFWLVDGHAAVFCIRDRDLEGREVVEIARKIARSREEHPVEDPSDRLDPVFDQIRDRVNDAEAWMAAYDLVMAHDGIHSARCEVGAALARQAVKLAPDDDTAWTKLAQALFFSGRYEDTAEAARRAIAINPGHARAHMLLGEALNRLGKKDEARAEWEKALALAGDDEVLKRIVTDYLKPPDPNSEVSKWWSRRKASMRKNEGDKQS